MNAARARLVALQHAAWRRLAAIAMALVLPPLTVVVFASWRWWGTGPALAVAATGVAAMAAWLAWRLRGIDLAWVARRLDNRHAGLEDSTALLLLPDNDDTRLQRLQRARVGNRLAAAAPADVRNDWPATAIAVSAVAALALLLAMLAMPARDAHDPSGEPARASADAAAASRTRIASARLRIIPPEYTALPARNEPGLDASAPAGSRLQWTITLDPMPEAASLQLFEGETIPMLRRGEAWHAELVLEDSQLYRVEVEGGPPPDPRRHRLEAVADQPPRVEVVEPDQNVVYAGPGQTTWTLGFQAHDDHGLGPAELVLTLASGSGEVVDFTEVRRTLEGRDIGASDASAHRHYTTRLDLDAIGVGPGDDLVARLEVQDNRRPEAQRSRSASVVLRWPPPAMGDVAGFDGLMQRTMPAYFRSQRQIIIDAEALIAERGTLDHDRFVARSNDIGADQQLLRLRYGQFMGEESEGGELGDGHDHDHGVASTEPAPSGPAGAREGAPAPAPRTSNPLFADDAFHQVAAEGEHDAGHADDHDHHDHDDDEHGGHDHAALPGPDARSSLGGDADALVAQFGHMHDIPEAATLLDPLTRETLRGALRAMWASEGELRIGEPEAALPHAHEALELIKQVQQANRIHLARVGLELPPIDEGRRLGGDLDGVSDRADPIEVAEARAAALGALWSALQPAIVEDADAPDFDAAISWVLEHRDQVPDPMALVEAIDAVHNDRDCAPCLERLRAHLWPALPLPAAGARPRGRIDASGTMYLQRLGHGDTP